MALPKPIITEADVHAVRACIAGTADAAQQVRAMVWIGKEACGVFDSPYVADGNDRETFVAIGRHQVGIMISAMQTQATLEAAKASDEAKSPMRSQPVTRRGKTK